MKESSGDLNTESIAPSDKRPHVEGWPALRLRGSYYHVINLFRIKRAAKRHGKGQRSPLRQPLQHEGWPITQKATLLSAFAGLQTSFLRIHPTALIPPC